MFLSEIFLKEVGDDVSEESVLRALRICDAEMKTRMKEVKNKSDLNHYFFNQANKKSKPNEEFAELMNFWDVYYTLNEFINVNNKKEIELFKIIYEVEGLYQFYLRKILLENKSEIERHRLEDLYQTIEKIQNTKYIKIFFKVKEKWKLYYDLSFDKFLKEKIRYYNNAIKNKLMIGMERESIVVVITDSIGITPNRIYGYHLKENKWFVCPTEILKPIKDQLFKKKNLGQWRGYIY